MGTATICVCLSSGPQALACVRGPLTPVGIPTFKKGAEGKEENKELGQPISYQDNIT